MRPWLALTICALLSTGCGDDTGDGSTGGSEPELDGRTFIATSITVEGADRLLVGGTELRITFEDDNLRVDAGCNQMGGAYEVEAERLTVEPMSSTEMGCEPQLMAQDAWVSGLFAEPVTFSLTGDDLRLTSGAVDLLLTDRAVASPDASLQGTTWRLDSLISGDAVSSVPGGVVATLVIEDGRARIDNGCNAVTADVVVEDATLTFTNKITTDVNCAGSDAGDVENAVNAILTDTVTWSITEHSLTVLRGSQGLGFRTA